MPRDSFKMTFVLAALMLAGVAAPAGAQPATATPRNGLEHNGLDYQPTAGGTVSKEEAAGVRPDARNQRSEDHELSQIDRQLLKNEGQNPNNAVAPAPK